MTTAWYTVCRGAEECQRAEDKTITLKKCKKMASLDSF